DLVAAGERVVAVDRDRTVVTGNDPAVTRKLVRSDTKILVTADCAVLVCQRAGIDGYRTAAARVITNAARCVVERSRIL
ncbi:hypothetical protein Q2354_27430, partial [Escherichia coli]|nr:hypothetical protein [Escherichia coli]